jgi:hypothetical protein
MWEFLKENAGVFKEVLESLYYISGIGMLATVIIGLKQLKVLKEDNHVKNKRAAVEKSIEYMNWFAKEFIPQIETYNKKWRKIEEKLEKFDYEIKKDFQLDEAVFEDQKVKQILVADTACGGQDIINQLEYVSAAFVNRIADEKLAFTSLATMYCNIVRKHYFLIAFSRAKGNKNLYSNTVKLYWMWEDRLQKTTMLEKMNEINEKMSNLSDNEIEPLGVSK